MNKIKKPVPIYSTPGDLGALLVYPYLFNPIGEWIGWVTKSQKIYSVHGHYVGWLSDEPRILRKRADDFTHKRRKPPKGPPRIYPPATVPLPPMMADLPFGIVDVLDEMPEFLPTMDSGDLRDDME